MREEDSHPTQLAMQHGNATLAKLTAQLELPDTTPMCVIQWGKQAFRQGEPAHITGEFTQHEGQGFFAKVRYEDDCVKLVDMSLPHYPHGRKPPWVFDRKVYIDGRDSTGNPAKVFSHIEHTADKEHWLEFIPKHDTRKARKVNK